MVGIAMRGAFVAAISAALACSFQTEPRSSTPTPNTAVVKSEASELIVRLGDLPAGYRLDSDEPVTLESMSGGSDRAIVRDQALRTGFVGGRTRVFFLDADAAMADRTAAVYLFVFKDAAAASEALEQAKPQDPSIGRMAIGEAVGDNAHGYRFTRAASDGTDREAMMIQFVYGNALSYVLLQGVPRSPTIGEVRAIALKQVAALKADAVGPARSTPQPRTTPVTKVSADLALRITDLPTGFTTDTSVALGPEDLSENTDDLKFWGDVGFRRGWGAIFLSPDGAFTVTSVVTVLNGTKVEEGYRRIVKTAMDDVYEISLGETVGDESVGLESHLADQSARFTARSVYFRYGDAVGWVNVQGPSGMLEAAFVIDLAKKLVTHLD
jgi:hypothetical protein